MLNMAGAFRKGRDYATNLYLTAAQLDQMIKERRIAVCVDDRCLMILEADDGFERLHYAAANQEALGNMLGHLSQKQNVPQVVDVLIPAAPEPVFVERDAVPATQTEVFFKQGFSRQMRLCRMVRHGARLPGSERSQPVSPITAHVCERTPREDGAGLVKLSEVQALTAHEAETEEILQMLKKYLDPYSDRIPTVNEFGIRVRAGHVLRTRSDDIISGALVYRPEKGASLLQYWYIDEAFLGEGIGGRLMSAYESLQQEARIFRVWVRSHNRNAVAIYEHYGYRPDRLIDEVLIRHM